MYMHMSTRDSGVAKGRPGRSYARPVLGHAPPIPALHAHTINDIEQCVVVLVCIILRQSMNIIVAEQSSRAVFMHFSNDCKITAQNMEINPHE